MLLPRETGVAALLGLALLLAPPALAAEIAFPKLTGRVVDEAGLLSATAERRIAERLEAHERATTNQVVVVTLPSLEGHPIEEYGYRLGRHWGIGQKGKDNGALLLVAPQERKVRIEVGYGLEGTLTDAISSNIVHAVVLPSFRRGDFEGGIEAGAAAMIEAVGGQYAMRKQPARSRHRELRGAEVLLILVFLGGFGVLSLLQSSVGGRRWSRGHGIYGGGGGFGGRGGFGGGGFGGGGGSFGGGGASGGW